LKILQPIAIKVTDTSRVWLLDVSTRISDATAKRIAPTDPMRMTASLRYTISNGILLKISFLN
jgi:hypothetical protein